jgi:hypothetical protein
VQIYCLDAPVRDDRLRIAHVDVLAAESAVRYQVGGSTSAPLVCSNTGLSHSNSWQPGEPQIAITLFSTWAPILPTFIRDNVLDQLILPKVQAAMADWSPRSSNYTLHGIVFPWLEHAGARMDEILQEAKRRLKSWLKTWRPNDGIPAGFGIWRDAYGSGGELTIPF